MNNRPIRSFFLLFILTLSACSKPDFTTVDGANGQFNQGKWVLINYWATWCGPCREEIPDLNKFAQANANVQVYGVNYDGLEGEPLANAIADLGIAFPSLNTDPAPQLGVARPTVLPTTLLLGPDGRVIATLTGPQTQESLARAIETAKNQD